MTPEPNPVTEGRTERVVRLDEQVKNMDEKLDKLLYMMEGNGKPGVLVRVDRLEQTAEGQKWLMQAFIGATVVLLVGFAWQVITNFEVIKQQGANHGTSTGRTGTGETN